MKFQFSTATRIIFGQGTSGQIAREAGRLGRHVCLVCGSDPGRVRFLIDDLTGAGIEPLVIGVSGEPDIGLINAAAEQVRESDCDVVIAVGGGSVLDAGKALAAMASNSRDILDYLEVVGQGMPLDKKPVPLIAVPTTSGTGSEATANAVLLSREHGVKVSLRSTDMIPDIVVADPILTASMPPAVTASTGMDALTQLIEAYVTPAAGPMTDILCRDGMMRAARSLRRAYEDGNDMAAREDMALAAMYSGMALANAKLGAVHGFAAPLGGEFRTPHGAVCAALLARVMDMNIRAMNEREPENPALARYDEIARILTGSPDATAEDGIKWVRALRRDLHIRGLAVPGTADPDLPDLASKAARASSMKGNPIELTQSELIAILRATL